MRGSSILTLALLAAACGAPTEPPQESSGPAGLALSLDTLNVEVQNLWIRIGVTDAEGGSGTLMWEVLATTTNPFWSPKIFSRAGARPFEGPDGTQVWGNVPRAYDLQLIVTGVNEAGDQEVDTLVVDAPRCRDPGRPGLICNPRGRGGNRAGR
ncbi:MAG: hypothetical protein HKO53_08565 [Gemmatimonadetes bacterium]|nr:hypothetical protein [Gemmatimonadota bacterium]NNM33105.1 hypothetical protein [Gemmatimonadota bacterium]